MNVASLNPWFLDFHTVQFSDGSGGGFFVLRSGCNSLYGYVSLEGREAGKGEGKRSMWKSVRHQVRANS